MLFDGLRLCKFFSFPSFFYRAVADSGPLTLGGAEHSRVVDFMLFGRERDPEPSRRLISRGPQ